MTLINTCENSTRLRVLYFSPGDTMPHVEKLGDIIRFHRLVINNYLDAPQALGNPKKRSSFNLLHGLEGNGYDPYQMSHNNFTMEAQDRGIVDHFRNWMSSHSIDIFPGTSNQYIKQIKDINVESYFDLICKILFVNQRDESQNNVINYVWDGTDASPIHSNPLELDENGVPGQDLWSSKELEVPFDVMCSFLALGTVLPLVPQNAGQDDLGAEPVVAGDWVKLRNIKCRIRKGLYEGVILHESKLGLLSPNTEAVRNCERAYAERLTSDAPRFPHWCPRPPQSMTVTGYDHVRASSLREVYIFLAPDDASAVDYTKEDMDDDDDGVIDSHVILPKPFTAAPADHIPTMTSDPVAWNNETIFCYRDIDDRADLAPVKLNDPLPKSAAPVTTSSGANRRRCVVKRNGIDAFGKASPHSSV